MKISIKTTVFKSLLALLFLCSSLSAVGIRYVQEKPLLFDPTVPIAYTDKENIECAPANACIYAVNEKYCDDSELTNDFFEKFSIDNVEVALNQNFDAECNLLLHEFFKTKIYDEAKKSIDQFIALMLSDYHVDSDTKQLAVIDQGKDYQWRYLHDDNNTIIGVAGSAKKTLSLKSTKKEETIQVIIDGCFSFPLLKIQGERTCGLKDMNFGQYCLLANTFDPGQLIPAANITTVAVTIEERPRFQWLITIVNNKTPHGYIALKADIFLGEKISLIEDACHINENQYYLAPRNPDQETIKQFINKENIDVESSETPSYISYNLLHSKMWDCVVALNAMGNIIWHNPLEKLECIKHKLDCFSDEDENPIVKYFKNDEAE